MLRPKPPSEPPTLQQRFRALNLDRAQVASEYFDTYVVRAPKAMQPRHIAIHAPPLQRPIGHRGPWPIPEHGPPAVSMFAVDDTVKNDLQVKEGQPSSMVTSLKSLKSFTKDQPVGAEAIS